MMRKIPVLVVSVVNRFDEDKTRMSGTNAIMSMSVAAPHPHGLEHPNPIVPGTLLMTTTRKPPQPWSKGPRGQLGGDFPSFLSALAMSHKKDMRQTHLLLRRRLGSFDRACGGISLSPSPVNARSLRSLPQYPPSGLELGRSIALHP